MSRRHIPSPKKISTNPESTEWNSLLETPDVDLIDFSDPIESDTKPSSSNSPSSEPDLTSSEPDPYEVGFDLLKQQNVRGDLDEATKDYVKKNYTPEQFVQAMSTDVNPRRLIGLRPPHGTKIGVPDRYGNVYLTSEYPQGRKIAPVKWNEDEPNVKVIPDMKVRSDFLGGYGQGIRNVCSTTDPEGF